VITLAANPLQDERVTAFTVVCPKKGRLELNLCELWAYREYTVVPVALLMTSDNILRQPNRAFILNRSSADLYEKWLRGLIEKFLPDSPEENRNDWGKGNHLEPCQNSGRGYLEATRNALLDAAKSTGPRACLPQGGARRWM
jgi:hypothetical protein